MSLFDIFETRMKEIFESGSAMAPLPFKKLAKVAVREMKECSNKVDGRTIAPSLYTILVNPQDDAVIAPLYQQVTDELVDFLAHEAHNGGYLLLANPMVRFIAVDDIKRGKSEVIAEVVSPEVLEQVRAEESDYLASRAQAGFGRASGGRPSTRGTRAAETPNQGGPETQGRSRRTQDLEEDDADLRFTQDDRVDFGNRRYGSPSSEEFGQQMPENDWEEPEEPARQPEVIPVTSRARVAQPAGGSQGPSCRLSDVSSGRTWVINNPVTIIGRDQAASDLVLTDTNVSRRHAELSYDGKVWHITDLGSTNGTRVNNLRTTGQDLMDGDIITMGLVTLSFREA